MQKIIAIAISSIVLAGCSDKPSPAEIERALTAQLQKRCEYASITGVKVLNTQYPDAQNKNRIDVKFSGAVNVKITGPIAEARANHEKAKKVFMSYVEDVESLNKFIAQEREKIDQALKEENANYANANWARSGITPELQRESDAAYKHRDESMKLLQQKIDAQANALHEKYAKEAKGLLDTNTSMSGVKSYAQPEKPGLPHPCSSMDPTTPLGILYLDVSNREGGMNEYFSSQGAQIGIQAERTMVKTENGWMLPGQM